MFDLRQNLPYRQGAKPEMNLCKPTSRPGLYQETLIGPLSALRIALWLGLVIGLAELVLTRIQKPLTDPSPGLFRMNRHIIWTIQTVDFFVFGLVGLMVALVLRLYPRIGVRVALGPLVFLATLTVLLSCHWLHLLACLAIASFFTIRITKGIDSRVAAFDCLIGSTLPAMAGVAAAVIGLSLVWQLPEMRPASASPPSAKAAAFSSSRPNVLLIVLDTVRADHLSLNGYRRDTSPNLSRLARQGIAFEKARSTAPWTLPSHASMMTGRWTHELSTGINRPLDGTHVTIAEYLASNGYATGGFVGNATYCGVETGLGRGFAHYEDHDLTLADILWTTALGQRVMLWGVIRPERRTGATPYDFHRKDAAQIRRDMIAWVVRQKGRPYFAFLNLFDAHDPYIPPVGFCRRFGVRQPTERDMTIMDRWFIQDKKKLTQGEIEFVLDSYDDGIAYLDEQLGELISDLEGLELLSNTLVIITADHGEHLGEHQLYGHASSLYDAEIHVPLVIILPGRVQGRKSVATQVSLRDLAATVADVTGLPHSPFPGRSLARFWTADAPLAELPSLSEIDGPVITAPNQGRSPVFRGPMKAVARGNYIYVHSDDGQEELFDIDADPLQKRSLAGRAPFHSILDGLRTDLHRLVRVGNPVTGSPRQE
jgi:arylsulfatase A-like enzyme